MVRTSCWVLYCEIIIFQFDNFTILTLLRETNYAHTRTYTCILGVLKFSFSSFSQKGCLNKTACSYYGHGTGCHKTHYYYGSGYMRERLMHNTYTSNRPHFRVAVTTNIKICVVGGGGGVVGSGSSYKVANLVGAGNKWLCEHFMNFQNWWICIDKLRWMRYRSVGIVPSILPSFLPSFTHLFIYCIGVRNFNKVKFLSSFCLLVCLSVCLSGYLFDWGWNQGALFYWYRYISKGGWGFGKSANVQSAI